MHIFKAKMSLLQAAYCWILFLFIHLSILYLLVEEFNLFIFKVIIDKGSLLPFCSLFSGCFVDLLFLVSYPAFRGGGGGSRCLHVSACFAFFILFSCVITTGFPLVVTMRFIWNFFLIYWLIWLHWVFITLGIFVAVCGLSCPVAVGS